MLSPGGAIRKHFNLFANIRPARTLSTAVDAVCPGLDVIIVRENTEGFYADRNMYDGAGEFMPTPDVALTRRMSWPRPPGCSATCVSQSPNITPTSKCAVSTSTHWRLDW